MAGDAEAPKATPATASDQKGERDPSLETVARLRETAKWLVATFGALGAVLIGSLQLSSLGAVEGSDRALAFSGFFLGILAATIAIIFAARVLVAEKQDAKGALLATAAITLVDRQYRLLLGGYESVQDLQTTVEAAHRNRHANYEETLRISEEIAKSSGNLTTADQERLKALDKEYDLALHRYQLARRDLLLARPVLRKLESFAELEGVRRVFKQAMVAVVVAVGLASIGVSLFAVFGFHEDSTEAASTPAIPSDPVVGVLDLTEQGKEQFGDDFGSSCSLDRVPVLALSRTESGTDLVTAPASTQCNLVRVLIPETSGDVRVPLPPEPDELR